jgi:tetratricopeptide (TPR) repeat protein
MRSTHGRFFLGFLLLLAGARCAAGERPATAKVVQVRPAAVEQLDGGEESPLAMAARIDPGSRLQTNEHGAVSLLLPDYLLLKMGPATRFTYRGTDAEGPNRGTLQQGKVWIRGRKKRTPFSIQTPTATAAVRGTEWYAEVDEDGTSRVGVLDGSVEVANEHGQVLLGPREIALVAPGKAPVKLAHVKPEDAVNWTLRYRVLWAASDVDEVAPALRDPLREALAAYRANDLARAFAILEAEEAAHAETPGWQTLAGFLLLVSGRSEKAKTLFTRADEGVESWALPAVHLGLAAVVEDRLGDAREHLGRARALQPQAPGTLLLEAWIRKAGRKVDAALNVAREAVRVSPRFPEAILAAATLAFEAGKERSCRAFLDMLPDGGLAPSHEAERAALTGFLALNAGRSTEALARFEESVALDAEIPDALIGLGIARFQLNRIEAGTEAILRATLLAPQIAAYQSYLAKAFYEMGLYEDALDALDRAERLDAKDPTPHLYRSLIAHSRHRPGLALRHVLEAETRNDNRAVLRGLYLLDRDRAVLSNNLSSIYDTLGFHHAGTRAAARAVEIDPSVASAHRNLYFALLEDPRLYFQAAHSERIVATLFAPPTRKGVVFEKSGLKSYQEVFNRAGADGVLYYNHFDRDDERSSVSASGATRGSDSQNTQHQAMATVAGKAEGPLAASMLYAHSWSEIDVSSQSASSTANTQDFGAYQMTTTTQTAFQSEMDQQMDTDVLKAFAKYRPAPNLDLSVDIDRDWTGSEGLQDSQMFSSTRTELSILPDPIVTGTETDTESTTETDGTGSACMLGARYHTEDNLHLLGHVTVRDREGEVISRTTGTSTSGSETTSDYDQMLVQGGVWKVWDRNQLQIGLRHGTTEDRSHTISTAGGTVTYDAQTGYEFEQTTGYLFDRWQPIDPLALSAGLFVHRADYTLADGRSHSETVLDPVVGLDWEITEWLRLRTAYIESLLGDEDERLQPTLVAGFPMVSASIADAFQAEERLVLQKREAAAALDARVRDLPLFLGIEAIREWNETSRFDPGGSEDRIETEARADHLGAYAEYLFRSRLALSAYYRRSELEVPDQQLQTRYNARAAYFFDNGLSLFVEGERQDREPDGPAAFMDEETRWRVNGGITWQDPGNRWRLDLEATHEQTDGASVAGEATTTDADSFLFEARVSVYF